MSRPYALDVTRHINGRHRAHIFLESQHHYGEGSSMGDALIELGMYLNDLKKPNDLEVLFKEIIAGRISVFSDQP